MRKFLTNVFVNTTALLVVIVMALLPGVLILATTAFISMLGWNLALASLFGLPVITFTQTTGLVILPAMLAYMLSFGWNLGRNTRI